MMNAFWTRYRPTLTIALASIAFGLAVTPAQAAFCGVPDDIIPIQKLTIAAYPKISHRNHSIDQSYIRIIDINGTYASSVTDERAGRISFYWEKPTGTWTLASANHGPSGWPKEVLAFFEDDAKPSVGGQPSCNNPNWKSHS
jgi:hypothetical protein